MGINVCINLCGYKFVGVSARRYQFMWVLVSVGIGV